MAQPPQSRRMQRMHFSAEDIENAEAATAHVPSPPTVITWQQLRDAISKRLGIHKDDIHYAVIVEFCKKDEQRAKQLVQHLKTQSIFHFETIKNVMLSYVTVDLELDTYDPNKLTISDL